MNDMRTPLARARGIGSGKTGTGHFWTQRVTAVALALLVPWLVGLLVSMVGTDVETVRAAIARPWNAILLSAFVVALFWHAKLGMQVIIEDYVHGEGAKMLLLLGNTFFAAAIAVISIFTVLKLSFGG